jgi:CheY-like chemotaxis protein
VKALEPSAIDLSITGEYTAIGGSGEHVVPAAGPALPTGVRVLVADDDHRIRRAIASSLGRLGFDVKVAEDGGPAIALAEHQHPDVALIDYSMPMSGLDVTRAIKARYGASTHVCILSGNDAEDVRLAAFDAGADDFLVKPISMTELRRRMAASARKQHAYIEARQAREQADRLLAWGTEASALLAHDLNNRPGRGAVQHLVPGVGARARGRRPPGAAVDPARCCAGCRAWSPTSSTSPASRTTRCSRAPAGSPSASCCSR